MEPMITPVRLHGGVGADARAMLRYQSQAKSVLVAYILWWLFGLFGGQRFYTGRTGSAIAMLVITLVSFPLCFFLIGFLGLAVTGIWAIIDAFMIPGWIRSYNASLVDTLAP